MTVAFFTHETFDQHTQRGHPEHAGRLQAVRELLKSSGIWDDFTHLDAAPATDAQILGVHTPRYLEILKATSQPTGRDNFGLDTYITRQSHDLARLAAGGVIAVVESVAMKQTQTGIAAVRPPGHHATPAMGMGFCLLSSVAIAAHYAAHTLGLERVAIVDFDVHHGNGTQDCLYEDARTLFISSHQSPLYPGTGAFRERGNGKGENLTLNLPVPANTGDTALQTLYTDVVIPMLTDYNPQLIIVSAGFDAHWIDPLATLSVSLSGFHGLVRQLIETANHLCDGKIVFVMEGGYDLPALSHGWLNIAYALLGKDLFSDPHGKASNDLPLDKSLLERYLSILP